MSLRDFLNKLANDVYFGFPEADNPKCPYCGTEMEYNYDDPIPDGYWICPNCEYGVDEETVYGYGAFAEDPDFEDFRRDKK